MHVTADDIKKEMPVLWLCMKWENTRMCACVRAHVRVCERERPSDSSVVVLTCFILESVYCMTIGNLHFS